MSATLKTERTLLNTSPVAINRLARIRVCRRVKQLQQQGQMMPENVRHSLIIAEVMSVSKELSNHRPENGLINDVRIAQRTNDHLKAYAL